MSLRSLGPQPTKMCPVSAAWCCLGVSRPRFCPDSGGWCGFVLGCLLPSLLPSTGAGVRHTRGCRKALLARRDGWTYNGRTQCEEVSMPTTEVRRRSRRLELRTTPDERVLIDRAVAVARTDLTEF